MKEYEVEIVTELDEVEIICVIAASPNEAETKVSDMEQEVKRICE